jgi:hypothetical protein
MVEIPRTWYQWFLSGTGMDLISLNRTAWHDSRVLLDSRSFCKPPSRQQLSFVLYSHDKLEDEPEENESDSDTKSDFENAIGTGALPVSAQSMEWQIETAGGDQSGQQNALALAQIRIQKNEVSTVGSTHPIFEWSQINISKLAVGDCSPKPTNFDLLGLPFPAFLFQQYLEISLSLSFGSSDTTIWSFPLSKLFHYFSELRHPMSLPQFSEFQRLRSAQSRCFFFWLSPTASTSLRLTWTRGSTRAATKSEWLFENQPTLKSARNLSVSTVKKFISQKHGDSQIKIELPGNRNRSPPRFAGTALHSRAALSHLACCLYWILVFVIAVVCSCAYLFHDRDCGNCIFSSWNQKAD